MATEAKNELSPEAVLKKFNARLQKMSKEQATKTLVDAGILTPKGNVKKPYRGVIVPVAKKSAVTAR